MTIGGSIALITVGAIFAFAVTWQPAHVDLRLVGVILMIGGAACLIASIAFTVSRRRARTPAEVFEHRRYVEPPQ